MHYYLVYQSSIANVFRVNENESPALRRLIQGTFAACEWFCDGLMEAKQMVEIYHCDKVGDIAFLREAWIEGPGDLYRVSKHPPGQRP